MQQNKLLEWISYEIAYSYLGLRITNINSYSICFYELFDYCATTQSLPTDKNACTKHRLLIMD